jgi:hypothetical protein
VRWPEKTACPVDTGAGVGRVCGKIASFFLDFLFLFHLRRSPMDKEKDKDELTEY